MWFKWRRNKSEAPNADEGIEIITDPAVRYVSLLLLQASGRPAQEFVLNSREQLPPAENYEDKLPEFQAVVDRFREMCVTDIEDGSTSDTGHIALTVSCQPFVDHVKFVDDDAGQALYYRTEILPIPKVPEAIWQQVPTGPEDDLLPVYDVKLRSGSMLKKTIIMQDGRLIGAHYREGRYHDWTGTVDFEPDEIIAIRRRSGSIMNRLGWSRWFTSPEA